MYQMENVHEPLTLAGITDIAGHYGVPRQTVKNWTEHERFPDPLQRLAMGPVYDLVAVKAWHERYRAKAA
jgi:hypothetical protein